MSEDFTNNRTTGNDEIDLLDLFRRMGRTVARWFNAIGKAILISIVFLIRNWLFLLLSIIFGTGVSYILKKSAKPVFNSDMVLKVNVPSAAEMISYLNRLHTFCLEDNKDGLAKALSLDEQRVSRVDDISAYWIIDEGKDSIPDFVDYTNNHDIYDTIDVRMKDRFDIRILTGSAEDISLIRTGILSYLNNNELFRQRNDLRLKQTGEMIARLEYDISELDSLQKIKYYEESKKLVPGTGGQMVFLQEQKTQLLYGDIYLLYQRKQRLEQQASIYKDIITIISDFPEPIARANGIFYYIKSIVPVFFFLTVIILIIKFNRRRLIDIYHQY